jgi:predicted trehalose synthase
MQGFLQAVPHDSELALAATWAGIGIKRTTFEEKARHLAKLMDTLEHRFRLRMPSIQTGSIVRVHGQSSKS